MTDPTHLRDLVQQTALGDEQAFAAFFRVFAPRIRAWLGRRMEWSATEDATQEVMLRVWRRAGRYDCSRASVCTWVFTIARNVAADRRRRVRHPLDPADPSWVADPQPSSEQALDLRRATAGVAVAVRMLPVEQADVVRQVFFDGATPAEIADRSGVAVGTVKSRLRLALGRLRGAPRLPVGACGPAPGHPRRDRASP